MAPDHSLFPRQAVASASASLYSVSFCRRSQRALPCCATAQSGVGQVILLLRRGEPPVLEKLAAHSRIVKRRLEFLGCERAGAVELLHADNDFLIGFLRDLLEFDVLRELIDLAAQGRELGE